jgi:2-polyprenyl-3-methyl-5-hydroxy-6-metoxy-1,4-benzoquinol methylase
MISSDYPTLGAMITQQLRVFPKHEKYLSRRFRSAAPADLAFCEWLCGPIMRATGARLPTYCDDYRWLCGMLLEEELFFRRENRYRLSTFAEAERTVYADRLFMARYLNGLFMTQLWWQNHSNVLRYYRDVFLSGNKQNYKHLEIGPGHGLFLVLAASAPNAGSIAGWDVSPASIAATQEAMLAMGASRPFKLSLVNMFEAPVEQFDSVTFSEVLEHLEDPASALAAISKLLAPDGRAFIHAPVNSPAPDHLWLFRSPEEIVDLVEQSGLVIEDTLFAPATGATLQTAREKALTISTVVVAGKTRRRP